MADDRAATAEAFRHYRRSRTRPLRNRLVEQHRWIAIHCAHRFANRGEPLDDLVQVAQLGVLKAVERFDPDVGVSFTTFAMPTVLGELRRHFRDTTWAVRVSRRVKDLHVELSSAVEDLTGKLGRLPTVDELAGHLGLAVDEVLEAMEAGLAYRAAPLGAAGGGETETADEADAIGDDDADLLLADERVSVRMLVRDLTPRERRIVYLRFFEGLSQSEIAAHVGVSQVHVSRLLRGSLASLRQRIAFMDERDAG